MEPKAAPGAIIGRFTIAAIKAVIGYLLPGLTNTWTMPVENRLEMELTGIKAAVGMKIQGPDLDKIQEIGA